MSICKENIVFSADAWKLSCKKDTLLSYNSKILRPYINLPEKKLQKYKSSKLNNYYR